MKLASTGSDMCPASPESNLGPWPDRTGLNGAWLAIVTSTPGTRGGAGARARAGAGLLPATLRPGLPGEGGPGRGLEGGLAAFLAASYLSLIR